MYITYELLQTGGSPDKSNALLARGAKGFSIPGSLVEWRVGEFEIGTTGKKVYAARITFVDVAGSTHEKLVEVPANAQNVNLHSGEPPPEYQNSLENVA
jgi:hypothetical protein